MKPMKTKAVQADHSGADHLWTRLREEGEGIASSEPVLASFVHATVLNHDRLESALSYHLSQRLADADIPAMLIRQVVDEAIADDPSITAAMRADLAAVFDRDPACRAYIQALLYFKGFHALQSYRVAHWLWRKNRFGMALYVQNRMSDRFGVDIHPAAKLGRGLMFDHASGIVIGETAEVGNDVSMLHGVTLGGTGKEDGDRHPKVRDGVLIGAGAKVLGNIEVGECARVAAGSVVLKPVPAHCTAAGIPARIVGCAGAEHPAEDMNHCFSIDGEEPQTFSADEAAGDGAEGNGGALKP